MRVYSGFQCNYIYCLVLIEITKVSIYKLNFINTCKKDNVPIDIQVQVLRFFFSNIR